MFLSENVPNPLLCKHSLYRVSLLRDCTRAVHGFHVPALRVREQLQRCNVLSNDATHSTNCTTNEGTYGGTDERPAHTSSNFDTHNPSTDERSADG